VGFGAPRHRFDPPSGRFRVRYAANRADAAALERFPARTITGADGDIQLVLLHGRPAALHLTRQANLEALKLDDRVSTGRLDDTDDDPLLATSQALSDAVYDWWDTKPPPLVYLARSMPSARSVAFTASTGWDAITSWPLREATTLLAHLVIRRDFTVPDTWLR
jgi:hypothetical protein